MIKKASWFLCFLVLAISCLDEPDCFRLNNNIVGISFKKMLGGEADTVALIGVQAIGTDSVFSAYRLVTGVYLPLNFQSDQTLFTLLGLEESDQLNLGFDVKSQFVSEECGARYVLSNLEVISHTFDSLRLVSNTPISSQAGAHIEVYRCPRTHILELSFRQLEMEGSDESALKINSISDDFSGVTRYVDTTLQRIYLPLNQAANSATFNLNFPDRMDTLQLNYARQPKKFFDLCGDQQLFNGLEVAAHDFDSLLIVNDSIQDPPVTNINVYRCPQTNLAQVYFRKSGTQVRSDTISLLKLTDDYSGTVWYANKKLTYVVLPLNPNAGQTEFTFELEGSIKKLTVTHTNNPQVLFNACGTQVLFSELDFIQPDPPFNFTSTVVKSLSVQFPVVTNFEIIQ